MKTPTKRATRRLAASIAIVSALAASSAWATDRTISENYTLSANETVDGVLTVASGVTVDLNGHRLTVQGLAGDGTITGDPDFVLSDLTSPSGTITWKIKADTANETSPDALAGNTTPRKLFDNDTSNNGRILMQKGSNNANMPLAVTYDFGEGDKKTINKYKIYGPSSYSERGPKDWTFEGSNDGTSWEVLHSMTGETWTNGASKEYPFPNGSAYRYYRIKFTASNDSSTANSGPYLQLNELEYFDTSVKPELHISVPEGASATNSTVAISGSVMIVKEGEGEFAEAKAGQTYTGGTVLTEGTYALAGTASLDVSRFTLGTDPAKPVTLRIGETATLANIPSGDNGWHLGTVATSTVYKAGGDWSLSGSKFSLGAPGALASFYHEGGTITTASRFAIGDSLGRGYFEISGGTIKTTGDDAGRRTLIGNTAEGTMVVKSGGNLVVENNDLFVGVSQGGVGVLTVDNGGTVSVTNSVVFNLISADSSGTVNLKSGGVLSAQRMYRNRDGSATFNFDGGTLVITDNNAANKLFSKQDGSGVVTVTVSENGGTIDNGGNANSSAIANTITGAGGLTFTGSGTTRVFANQAYLGTTVVSNGTTLSVTNGITFAGPVAFAAGSTLNVASYTAGVVPFSASALTLPAEGTVGLTLNGGAFPAGVYAICSATGVTAADGAKFAPSTGDETASWKVVGGTLVLTVGTVADNYWTGFAGDGKMSTPGNWAGGTAPTDGEDVDFSSVTVTTTIDADIANVTFGTVTMGSGAVIFTNDNMAAKSFSDMEMVAVAANSTVTLDGDLVFGTNVESHVCRYVFEGGKFVVTGKIIASPEQTGNLFPHWANDNPGWISANGLVNNAAGDKFYLVQADNWQANWMIGEDGISGAYRYIVGASGKGNATIKATADFSVSADIIQYHNLVLEPDGHVITLGTNVAVHAGGIISGGANGLTTVTGPGKVVVNYNVTNLTSYYVSYPNAFTVADGGTLAIVPGANPSVSSQNKGTLTVNSGATLEVAESGMVTIGSNLALADGAALGFNYTNRNEPVLNLTGKTVTFDEGESTNVVVKISAAEGARAKPGANVLTSGGKFADAKVSLAANAPNWALDISIVNGDIVLDAKPAGTIFIVR